MASHSPVPDCGDVDGGVLRQQGRKGAQRVHGHHEDEAHDVPLENGLGVVPQVLDDLQGRQRERTAGEALREIT